MATASDPLNTPLAKSVESILRQDPRARDNDTILIIHLLQTLNLQLSREQIHALMDFDFEKVILARQRFQAEGKYPPNYAVARRRRLKTHAEHSNTILAYARQYERVLGLDEGSIVLIDASDVEFND